MKVEGDIRVAAPRERVFARRSAVPFFAFCLGGPQDLNVIDGACHIGALCRGTTRPQIIAAA